MTVARAEERRVKSEVNLARAGMERKEERREERRVESADLARAVAERAERRLVDVSWKERKERERRIATASRSVNAKPNRHHQQTHLGLHHPQPVGQLLRLLHRHQ